MQRKQWWCQVEPRTAADRARAAGFTQCKAGLSGFGELSGDNHEQPKHVPEQGSDESTPASSGEEQEVTTKARRAKSERTAAAGKPGKANAPARSTPAKSGGKSKKDQLIALVSKPNGAHISVIVERLGWQAHTVRAALSGLRKQGIEIATTRSPKTGETVYVMVTQSAQEGPSSDEGTS